MVAALTNDIATVARVSVTLTPTDPHLEGDGVVRTDSVGSNSIPSAEIQDDAKACGALSAYCSSVVTTQNSFGVQGVQPVMEEFMKEQLRLVLSDMKVDMVAMVKQTHL